MRRWATSSARAAGSCRTANASGPDRPTSTICHGAAVALGWPTASWPGDGGTLGVETGGPPDGGAIDVAMATPSPRPRPRSGSTPRVGRPASPLSGCSPRQSGGCFPSWRQPTARRRWTPRCACRGSPRCRATSTARRSGRPTRPPPGPRRFQGTVQPMSTRPTLAGWPPRWPRAVGWQESGSLAGAALCAHLGTTPAQTSAARWCRRPGPLRGCSRRPTRWSC